MKKDKQIVQFLLEEKRKLEEILAKAERFSDHAPEGSLHISKHGNGVQYYHRTKPGEKNGVYIPAGKMPMVRALAQKRYCKKIIKNARRQLKAIDTFLDQYDPKVLEKAFLSEGEKRQSLIKPFEIPDELFARQWQQEAYESKPFLEGTAEHYSQNNERVRSKSEVLIADALLHAGIPYRYECRLQLDHQIIHPDFTVLRMSDRTEVFWEHLGWIDDMEYRNRALERIRLYQKCGIYPGDRLIITAESYKIPLNLSNINGVIRHYLL